MFPNWDGYPPAVLPSLPQRTPFRPPLADAAVHGDSVLVAHLLQVVGGERRAKSAAAIEDEFLRGVGHLGLDIALDHALADVDGAGKVVLGVLAFLAHVDERGPLAAVKTLLHFVNVGLADALLGIVDDVEKTGRVLVSHVPSGIKNGSRGGRWKFRYAAAEPATMRSTIGCRLAQNTGS